MPKQLRDFIAVAGARARWLKADVKASSVWAPAMREYLNRRDDYFRAYGENLVFLEAP